MANDTRGDGEDPDHLPGCERGAEHRAGDQTSTGAEPRAIGYQRQLGPRAARPSSTKYASSRSADATIGPGRARMSQVASATG
jgi:hypothetical protein